jgi:hypothetical protein
MNDVNNVSRGKKETKGRALTTNFERGRRSMTEVLGTRKVEKGRERPSTADEDRSFSI